MLLERGPVDHLVADELVAPIPDGELAAFVAGGLDQVGGAGDALLRAQAAVGDAIASGPGPGFGSDLDEATAAHASHAGELLPTVGDEVAVAAAAAQDLAGMAGRLPPADYAPAPQASQPSDAFDDLGEARPGGAGGSSGGAGGGSSSGGGGGATSNPNAPDVVNFYRARVDEWTRANFGRPAEGGELGDVDRLYAIHGTITDDLFDQLIAENFRPRL